MGKIPFGVSNKHIQQTFGGDSNVTKFYCTTNNSTYGRKWSKFEPRPGKHTGTGYLSNFRPGVYYNARLDQVDNPTMGRIVSDNYHSVTSKSFQPSYGANGKETLPCNTIQVGSGFVRQKPITFPTQRDVQSVAIDTRVASAPADISPLYKPHLHKIRSKDPVSAENGGYGPAYMSTESQQRFSGRSDQKTWKSLSSGRKEGSGFTNAQNNEPITFYPDKVHKGDVPAFLTHRPTRVSIMKTDFRPSSNFQGNEALPRLAYGSTRDTGFTSGTKARPSFVHRVMSDAYDKSDQVPVAKLDRTRKQDPAEFINMNNPNNYSSIASATFTGASPVPSEAQRLGAFDVGSKELTGYSENNDSYVFSCDNPARFVTHYQSKFVDRTPKGLDRLGHTWGGIQEQKPDGFTKSTHIHGAPEPPRGLSHMEPYVARSIKARDVFYDDHTHDQKLSMPRAVTMVV